MAIGTKDDRDTAPRSAKGFADERTALGEPEAPLPIAAHDDDLDPRTVLALQRLSGNAAVSRLVQQRAAARNGTGAAAEPERRGIARFLDVRKLLEQGKRPKSFFEKAFDFAKGMGKRIVGGGQSLFERVRQFTQGVGKGVGKVGAGAKSLFGKAFAAVTGGAKKAWSAATAAAGKVGAGVKAAGGKVAAGAKKAASAPKGFFQMVLGWARKFLGLDAKETEAALAEEDQPGGGRGKKGKAGAAGEKGAKGKGAKGGAGGRAAGGPREAGEGEPEGAGGAASAQPAAAGPSVDGAATERPKSPEQDPRFLAFRGQVQGTAQKTKAHAPASAKAAEAQGAAKGPPNEVASQAKGAQVEEMAAQKPGTFDKKAFMDAVKKAIEAASPKNLKEATEFSESGKAGEVKDKVAGMVTQNKEAAEQGIKEKTEAEPDPSKGEAKEVVPMADERPGPKPGPVGAANAMPPPATAAEVDLSQGPKDIEQEMASNDVTEEQLRNSNEPDMIQAADAKKEAEKHSTEAPKEYRAQESTILESARGEAQQQADSKVQGMHAGRVGALMQIAGAKGRTKTADELKRAKVASDMEAIYAKTKTDVTKILDGIEPKVVSTFESGEARARQAFETYVDVEVSAYKKRRYSGWRGKLRWVRDKFRGLPGEVNKYYETGKNQYLAAMDGVIENVAGIVATNLNAAKARIASGQLETKKYVDGLPKDLKRIGKEAAENMGDKFAQLDDEVNSKSDELVQTIAGKYVESRDALDARIEELKAANRGLIDRAIDAVKGVVKTILALKDLLMTVLRKAISVIGDILSHPIRFIENFMSGVKAGLNLFVDRIEDYLKQALIKWLFGPSVLGGTKIEAPKDLSPKSVLSIVLQVIGLSKEAILDLLRKKVGGPAVSKLQSTVQWIGMLVSEGPAGLWNFVSDKVGDLYETVVGGIMDFLKNRVIRAGIMWLISLLNPAGALVRIVKAIVDVVTFIFERAQQIGEFINAVLDAVIAVAKGQTSGVAQKIADALGRGLELAIGLLASLLGIGGIAQTVRGIIDKVRAPIKRVMNKLIDGAVRMAKRVWGGIKSGGRRVKAWAKTQAGKVKQQFTRPRTPEQEAGREKRLDQAERELKPKVAAMIDKGTSRPVMKAKALGWSARYRVRVSLRSEGAKTDLIARTPRERRLAADLISLQGGVLHTMIRQIAEEILRDPAVRQLLEQIVADRAQGLGQVPKKGEEQGQEQQPPRPERAGGEVLAIMQETRAKGQRERIEMGGGIPVAERQSFSKRPGHIETGTDLGKYPAIAKEFERLKAMAPELTDADFADAVLAVARGQSPGGIFLENPLLGQRVAEVARLMFQVEAGRSPSALVTSPMAMEIVAGGELVVRQEDGTYRPARMGEGVDPLHPMSQEGAVAAGREVGERAGVPVPQATPVKAPGPSKQAEIDVKADYMMAQELRAAEAYVYTLIMAEKPLYQTGEQWERFIKHHFRDYLKGKAREFAVRST